MACFTEYSFIVSLLPSRPPSLQAPCSLLALLSVARIDETAQMDCHDQSGAE